MKSTGTQPLASTPSAAYERCCEVDIQEPERKATKQPSALSRQQSFPLSAYFPATRGREASSIRALGTATLQKTLHVQNQHRRKVRQDSRLLQSAHRRRTQRTVREVRQVRQSVRLPPS